MKKIRLLVFWVGVLISFNVTAGSFDVDRVSVSAEAETAVAARTQALQAGQEEAFKRLTAQLVAPEYHPEELSLEPADVLNMVQDVSVRDERTTATRYMASISVRFNSEAVQRFFADKKVPYLSEMPPKSVVVPIFMPFAGQTLIFDEANPLYHAFKNRSADGTLYSVVVPLGDAEDIAGVANGETQTAFFEALMKKYRAAQVLVVIMRPDGGDYLVQARVYPEKEDGIPEIAFQTAALPTQAQSAEAAVEQLMTRLDTQWRSLKTNRFEISDEFTLIMPLVSLDQWYADYQRLKALDFLTRVEMRALREDQVVVLLGFKGSESALLRRLQQRGLAVDAVNGVFMFRMPTVSANASVNFEIKEPYVQ